MYISNQLGSETFVRSLTLERWSKTYFLQNPRNLWKWGEPRHIIIWKIGTLIFPSPYLRHTLPNCLRKFPSLRQIRLPVVFFATFLCFVFTTEQGSWYIFLQFFVFFSLTHQAACFLCVFFATDQVFLREVSYRNFINVQF